MAIPVIAAALSKAAMAAEKVTSVADKIGMHSNLGGVKDSDSLNIKDVNSLDSKPKLSDAALYTRVEASAHSASRFFRLPDIQLKEGQEICVYRGFDICPDKDVFEYNLGQFKYMECTSFEDMSKVWAHECGHRLLRVNFQSPWVHEFGGDFFVGVRSQMLGLPSGNFEKFLSKTDSSLSHPPGDMRIQAINYGRQVVKDLIANGQTPTLENCLSAFANSPFAKMQPLSRVNEGAAAFIDSKSYHYAEAAKAQENANYYTKQSEKAAERGDFNKAKEYARKADSYQAKVKDEKRAAEMSTSKLVDSTTFSGKTNEVSSSNVESTLPLEQNTRTELTKEDRVKLKERTGWSDAIVDAIRTKEEAEIYENAGLIEGKINGKPALLQPDLKGDACSDKKWPNCSNREFAEDGYPPRSADGKPIELHHIGQNPDSPLAELTHEQHHKNGNFAKLHTFDESKIDRGDFSSERAQYWMERSKTM